MVAGNAVGLLLDCDDAGALAPRAEKNGKPLIGFDFFEWNTNDLLLDVKKSSGDTNKTAGSTVNTCSAQGLGGKTLEPKRARAKNGLPTWLEPKLPEPMARAKTQY